MARKVYQVRYYGNSNGKNQPSGLSANRLQSGSVFSQYTPMKQLGIQTLPGVKFYLNGSIEPVTIGATGIYELNVENMTEITSLRFDSASLNMINEIETGYLIVDILYETSN